MKAIDALEGGKEKQVHLLEAFTIREENREKLQEARIELEAESRQASCMLALHRTALEERGVQNDHNQEKKTLRKGF